MRRLHLQHLRLRLGQSLVEEEIYGFTTSPDGDWYFGADPIQLALGAQTVDPLDPFPITMEADRIIGDVDIAAIDAGQPDGATVVRLLPTLNEAANE